MLALWRSRSRLVMALLALASTACFNSCSSFQQKDLPVSPSNPDTSHGFPLQTGVFIDEVDEEGNWVVSSGTDVTPVRVSSATSYEPNTGDPGLDALLLGCYLTGPSTPYRYQANPQVLLALTVADDAFAVGDPGDARAIVDEMLAPGTGSYNLPNVPDVYEWNSYGRCIPEFIILAPEGDWHYIPADEYYVDEDGDQQWGLGSDYFQFLDSIYNLKQYVIDGILPTFGYIADMDDGFAGVASPYPGPINRFGDGTKAGSSSFKVDYTSVLVGSAESWKRTVTHELVHAIGRVPDLYKGWWIDEDGNSVHSMNLGFGLMGQIKHDRFTSMYIIGFEKALMGWVPMLRLKYDHRSLAVQEAGIPQGCRDFYYLSPQGEIGREFFLIENVGVSPSHTSYNTGLMVTHFLLPRLKGDERDRGAMIAPWYAWMTANGTEPWSDSGREWKTYWGDLDTDDRGFLFPKGASGFTETGIPNSRLWSGEDSGIRLHNIVAHDGLVQSSVPASYSLDFEGMEQMREYSELINYGVITLDAEVGRKLDGDVNGDGIVNNGDYLMLQANVGKKIGVDVWAVPIDVNGDGQLKLVLDRDGDGYIATTERIYDSEWRLIHDSGDWLDVNCDGRNDLDPTGTGVFDTESLDANGDGIIDFFDPDGDGVAELVPPWLDTNGDGVINELDNTVIGYNWNETTFEEIWIDLPVPEPLF